MTAVAPLTSVGEWGNTIPAPGNAGYGALTAGTFPGAGAVGAFGVGPVGIVPAAGSQIPTDGSGAVPAGVSRFVGLAALIGLAIYFDTRVFRRRV